MMPRWLPPAIGVGPGNAPAWVCADADVEKAAGMVVASKAFDHGIICGSENNLVVDQSVRDDFIAALQRAGAAVLNPAECDRLAQVAFDECDGRLRRAVLGQAATAIAAQAGVAVPAGTRLLVAPLPREAVPGPYGQEKLAPILSLFTADGQNDGIRPPGTGRTPKPSLMYGRSARSRNCWRPSRTRRCARRSVIFLRTASG
jgi:acyl-CoA reductase-like NAD-dependent aldehyde dehydrogenase